MYDDNPSIPIRQIRSDMEDFGSLAQLVANRSVAGSSPARTINKLNYIVFFYEISLDIIDKN